MGCIETKKLCNSNFFGHCVGCNRLCYFRVIQTLTFQSRYDVQHMSQE